MRSIDDKIKALNQISQKKFLDILDKIPGRKDFIIDPILIKPLEHIVGVGKLRLHGVDKIYKLEKTAIPCSNTQRVFFIQGDLITAKIVCDKINSELSQQNDGNSYHLIIVHRKLGSVIHLLEEEGVIGFVTTYSFQWELINLDDRVLSLEFQSLYKNLFVEGDQSYLPCIAKAIWTLQMLFGRPHTTVVQGKYAHLVDNMINIYCDELGEPNETDCDVSCFVILDRDLDYTSTLLTGGTYSCLLDEVFGIKSGFVDINAPKNQSTQKKDKQQEAYYLSGFDKIYSQIKNRHFSDVFLYLSAKTKELNSEYKRSQSMNVQEMKHYVANELASVTKLKKTLAYHIAACEAIINDIGQRFESLQNTERNIIEGRNRRDCITYIEECLAMNKCSKHSILRLMCLLSLTQDGLLTDEYQRLRLQFLHIYGYQNLSCFLRLEKTGLCVEQPVFIPEVKGAQLANKVVQAVSLPTRKSTFYAFAQKLKLFPELSDEYDLKNPKDLGYVFGGSYIPTACQIINQLIKQEISTEDLKKIIPNITIKRENTHLTKPLRSFVVFIIGGVTYAEISAFQLLEKLTGSKVIIASTSITNGNLLMNSFL